MKVDKAIMDGYEIELWEDEPSYKEWIIHTVGDGECIADIQALYNTDETYSPFYGMTHRRTGAVKEWSISFRFDDVKTDLIELITARYPQPHFKTVRSAFKWAVVVIEEYLLANAKEEEA
jgi:hypothetical protein